MIQERDLKNMIQDRTNCSSESIQHTESTNLNIFRKNVLLQSADESPASHKLKYNGRFSNSEMLLLFKTTMDKVQILQSCSYRGHSVFQSCSYRGHSVF